MSTNKLTTRAFIEKARVIHGEKYGYERVEYVHSSVLVEIYCSVHGAFWQAPRNHLSGYGCAACGTPQLTTAEFIEKARAVHGERYGYERVEYVNSGTKVELVCVAHGVFEQIPYTHLKGRGCLKCANARQLTTAEFIEKARAVHGERYGYERVENLANQDHNITITCLEHGPFKQVLRMHLRGSGCLKCFAKRTSERRKSTADYIAKARAIHGSKYDYSKVEYLGPSKKILIVCPVHGEFEQKPSNHLLTGGCKKCGIARRVASMVGTGFRKSTWISIQKGRKATLYIIYIEDSKESFYKVGITYRNVSGRFSNRLPYDFKTVALYKSYDAAEIFDLEHSAHAALNSFKYKPQKGFQGETECFSSILPLLSILPSETFFLSNRTIK